MNIRSKITLAITLTTIVSFIVIGVSSYFITKNLYINQLNKHLNSVADMQTERVASFLAEISDHIDLIAQNPLFLKSIDEYNKTPNDEVKTDLNSYLYQMNRKVSLLQSVSVFDGSGTIVLSSDTAKIGSTIAPEISFLLHSSKNKVPGQIVRSESNEIIMKIPISLEVKSLTLLVVINLDHLTAITSNYVGLGNTGETVLADYQKTGARFLVPLRFDANAALNREIKYSAFTAPIIQAKDTEDVTFYNNIDYRGKSVYSVTRYLDTYDWGIVVKQDTEEALSFLQTLKITLLILSFVFLLILIILSLLVSQSIAAPINTLTTLTENITEGNWSLIANETLKGEMGMLATAFNSLMLDMITARKGLDYAQKIAHLGNWELDINTGAMKWSREMYRLWSLPLDCEVTLENFLAGIAEEEREQVSTLLKNTTEQEKSFSIQFRVNSDPTNERLVTATGEAQIDNKSQTKITGIILDETERFAIEEKLQLATETAEKALEQFNLVLRATEDGIWDWSIESNELYFSPAWKTMLGYSEEEIENSFETWEELIHPEDLETMRKEIFAITNKGSSGFSMEYQMRCKEGHFIWILNRAKVTNTTAKGQALRVVGTHVDIQKQKKLEQELNKARELAEESSAAKSNFLANMSHEIRTPMNAIIGMAGLALRTNLDQKQYNYIYKVKLSAESLLGIINDILDFSKIEANKLELEHREFLLDDLLDSIANFLSLKAGEKSLELVFHFRPDIPKTLIGDSLRLRQILVNLGSNAIKFTSEDGEVIIGAELKERTEKDVLLHFYVQDNGIGISPEAQEKLFESFSQADATTTRKYGGTGLGLAISKQLVDLMNGEIWVESQEKKGSTFHFTCRLAIDPTKLYLEEQREVVKPLKILITDDNQLTREVLTEMVHSFGYTADSAGTGEEAIEMVLNAGPHHYDLILMDWKMPGMDGIEATKMIQQELKLTNLPSIIMITAFEREKILEAAQGLTVLDFLSKPVTPSSLFDSLSRLEAPSMISEHLHHHGKGKLLTPEFKLSGTKVLLAEDNVINQELATELLGCEGIQVRVASNGVEALSLLTREPFDIILMDIQMPIMDGYECTEKIRQIEEYKEIPIIAMTANAFTSDKDKALKSGMSAHVSKPIDPDELFSTMQKLLSQSNTEHIQKRPPESHADSTLEHNITGVDTEKGLLFASGNKNLYRRVLQIFHKQQKDFEERIGKALQKEDYDKASEIAHDLKSVSGNIGADELHDATKLLEEVCKNSQIPEDVENTLSKVIEKLSIVLSGISNLPKD